jgi:hypothetical protein
MDNAKFFQSSLQILAAEFSALITSHNFHFVASRGFNEGNEVKKMASTDVHPE